MFFRHLTLTVTRLIESSPEFKGFAVITDWNSPTSLLLGDCRLPVGTTVKVFVVEQPEPGDLAAADEGLTAAEIERVMRDLAKLGLDEDNTTE